MSKTCLKISSHMVISRVFPCKFLQIHITSVSGCLRFTFKICQTVAGTSMTCQFHEFFRSHFGGILLLSSTVRRWRRAHGRPKSHALSANKRKLTGRNMFTLYVCRSVCNRMYYVGLCFLCKHRLYSSFLLKAN